MCGVCSILDPQLEHAQFILEHLDSSPGSSSTSKLPANMHPEQYQVII